MAYFSNGTEGMIYESAYCSKCVHLGDEDGPGCPVLGLHLDWNYEQCSDKEKAAILNSFIPRIDKGLGNGQCVMFVEAAK